MTSSTAQNEVLGRLLIAQQTLDALPDERVIAEFTARALLEVPGVSKAHLCLRPALASSRADFESVCRSCTVHLGDTAAERTPECALAPMAGYRVFWLRTARGIYGLLAVRIGDRRRFRDYEPYIENFANAVVRTIESTRYLAQLKQANAELTQARESLERTVAERNAELADSEARFRSLTEMSSDFYWESDAEHRFTARGSAATKQSTVQAFQRGAQIGHRRWEIPYLSPDEDGWQAHRMALDAHQPFRDFEFSRVGADGAERFLSISGDPVFDASGAFIGYRGVGSDITERKQAERNIHRLTQLYAVLSQCNEAIVRCASQEELFRQVARVAVQFGGMKMAWIGMIDPDTRLVRPVASFGDRSEEYLQGAEISADADSPFGRGFSGTAMREDRPVWCQDLQNEPSTAAWHERRARFDFGASASLPLHRNGVPVGILDLYAGEVGAFDEAARKLLVEMATDIDFALDNFAREAARQQAEENLRAAAEQFRGLVEQSVAGVYIVQDGKLAYVNSRAAEIIDQGGVEVLIGTDPLQWVAEPDRDRVAESLRQLLDGEAHSVALDFGILRGDGVAIQVGAHATRATHQGRPAVIGLLQDISEKKRAEEQIQRYLKQLQTAFMSTVEVATTLSEMRDPYTAGHERRVGKIAAVIGAELGLDEQRIEGLRVAGFLHDIGKITIPAEILSKPGKLTSLEYQLIQGHPQSGYDVLKDVEFPWPVAEVALQHHERMDGSGYPQRLKGEAILLEARIMAVADVMEAMSSHRPYRPGLGIDKALAEIERGRGSAYDPAVADACLRLFRERGCPLPA
ncbi:MAG TPA: HD domain-containing phosphohydrolase [Burkholderiales bacterium]|nr:HD domain-containing phosphohydrolase [Burkholderiales bacterium]